MPTKYYYGRKTPFVGKTLFEILGNLRNFGVGRMLIKQEELRLHPGTTSYYIVKKVEPMMDDSLKQGAIHAERIFMGQRMPGLSFVEQTSWHSDWQLIPKHEEGKYLVQDPPIFKEPELENKSFEVPPLMDRFLKRHFNRSDSNPMTIKLDYKPTVLDYGMEPSKPMTAQLKDRFRNK